MKRKEWVILATLIAGVAALELFGPGDDMSEMSVEQDFPQERTVPGRSIQSDAPRSAEVTAPPGTATDPMEAFRTVRLHVTGMT